MGVVTHAELLSNIKNTPTDSNGQTKNTTGADLNTSSTKACGNHHKVTVHVKNEDDEPVPSVPIEIQASGDNDFKDEGITNTDGSFTSQVPKEIENIKIGVGEGLLQRTGTVELEAEKDHIEGEFIYTSLWTNMRRLF